MWCLLNGNLFISKVISWILNHWIIFVHSPNALGYWSIIMFWIMMLLTYVQHLIIYRDYRSNRTALFDGIEEGGIRATSYSSHEISEHDNDLAIEGLQDRVNILKRVSKNYLFTIIHIFQPVQNMLIKVHCQDFLYFCARKELNASRDIGCLCHIYLFPSFFYNQTWKIAS